MGGPSTEGAWMTQLARVALCQKQRQFLCEAFGRGARRGYCISSPTPTDLRPVLVPDGSPDAVVEGRSVSSHVSTQQGLCAWWGQRQGPPRVPLCPRHSRGGGPQAMVPGVPGTAVL